MKKLLCILMAATMILGMAACSKDEKKSRSKDREKKETEEEIDLDEIRKNKGVLLEIRSTPQGAMTLEDFESGCYSMYVDYSGDARLPNPIEETALRMSDEDFLKIYLFCTESFEDDSFSGYSEDVCDGTTYTFIYYDLDGNAHTLYSGYIYSNEILTDIVYTVSAYQID